MATARQVFDADKMMKAAQRHMRGPRKRKLTVCKAAILGTPEQMQTRSQHRWLPEHCEATKAGPKDDICERFAKGKCPLGRLCRKQHQIPIAELPFSEDKDIFGRERSAPVAAKECQVEVLHVGRTFQVDDEVALHGGTVHAVLLKRLRGNFECFGRIEKVQLATFDGRAELVFATRAAAEFAVEAMNAQVLMPEPRPEDAPVLTVRFPAKEDQEISSKPKTAKLDVLAEVEGMEDVVALKGGGGLLYKVIKRGDGSETPNAGTKCAVHYEGQLLKHWLAGSKKTFDSSYARQRPSEFAPNQVIKGWTMMLQRMVEGDKVEVFLPASLGYGEKGAGDDIPANAPLKFTIELLKIHGGRSKRTELL